MANVLSDLKNWSATASSNQPDSSDTATIQADLQQIQATVRQDLATKGADIASASTTDLGAVAGYAHDITGTTTITSFGTVAAGITKLIKFAGALTLTHNATSLILPSGANITTAAGDTALAVSEGSGNWRVHHYTKAAIIFPATGTLATLAGTEELTNKTLTSAVGKGTWTASGTWTLPALTFGGNVSVSGTPSFTLTGCALTAGALTCTTIIGSGHVRIGGAADNQWVNLKSDSTSASLINITTSDALRTLNIGINLSAGYIMLESAHALSIGTSGNEAINISSAGLLKFDYHKAGTTTRAAGDCYLLVDASGNVHVSAVGPAS